ncbi:NlpC/P60 family protein [Leuconostoc mesenteroides]|jgi:cell wall-associated NlpC family hydrolase|uniref:NlpC/P60 family protein n=1 Tax=Leuconostoc mesenteroides TaxID=1245 RepID=UPI000E0949FA|nr:NlpC/P60 family protein [Leuconostoc mesenteroides]MCH3980062.1 NlpC/P60 family protein [Leuconostoc mesenteroides]MCI1689296.1 NlpC/P60 family protein [Leuconostoc mesenteroides]MCI2089128.1 NlpC/P60 family protein [Leuconostoc mesenteroides]MCI2119472.1 NlpC/P60 family protein [Leuconostoc mesenteroides]MCM6826561.1 NlpC/P60 family protein [Leuconostoc mesenteroides]
MERLDKKVVASGLSLLGLVGVGSGIAHADDVKSTVNKAVNSVAEAAGLIDNKTVNLTQKSLTIPKDKVAHIETPAEKKVSQKATTKLTSYKVKAGDSLWSIAHNHNLNVDDLVSENNNSDLISVGQTLNLPTSVGADTQTTVADQSPTDINKSTDSYADSLQTAASAPVSEVSAAGNVESTESSVTSSTSSQDSLASSSAAESSVSSTPSSEESTLASTADSSVSSGESAPSSSVTESSAVSSGSDEETSSATEATSSTTSSTADVASETQNTSGNTSSLQSSETSATSDATAYTSSADSTATDASANINSSYGAAAVSSSESSAGQQYNQLSSTTNSNGNLVNLSTGSVSQIVNSNTTQSTSGNSAAIIALAQQLVAQNIPYVWGGGTPSTGFDCSGLVSYVFKNAAGISLPHSSVEQEMYTQKKSVSQAQPGDLLFWGTPGASYHVAIYIGNNQYIAAPKPGLNVRVETISPNFLPSFAGSIK